MFHIYADGKLLYYPSDDMRVAINPKVTVEMGKAGSLTFGLPHTNTLYNELRKLKTLVTVEWDEEEIFRGRVLSEEKVFNNVKTAYCEGDLAYLVDSVQKGEAYTGTTHDLFRRIIANHNARVEADKRFKVGIITIEDREIIISGQSDEIQNGDTGEFDYKQIAINSITNDWSTTFDYIQSCLIDYCGGYLRTRKESDGIYIDLLADYFDTATQEIEFGVNLLDLTEEVSVEDLFTVLIPLGDDNLTIESVNGGSDELIDEAAVSTYGRILRTHVFDNVTEPTTLLENGLRYLASNVNVPITITIKAVDLHLLNPEIQPIYVGHRVRVKSAPHGIGEYLTCTKIEYDLENPANTVYTFGNPKQSLTERYRKDIKKAEETASSGGGSGAGGAGGAAASKAEDDLEKFFYAWINVDPDAAHVDLGALSKIVEDTRTVLTEVGIDLDGVTGNVNINSLRSELDAAGKEIAKQAATIDLNQKETEASISLVASRYTYLEGVEKGHYAELKILANDLESAIELKADRVSVNAINVDLNALKDTVTDTNDILRNQVGIVLDGSKGNVNIQALSGRVDELGNFTAQNKASIETLANNTESKITMLTSSVGSLETKTASIELKANNLESSIELKADKTTLNSKVSTINSKITNINGEITNINTEITNVKKLIADEISALKVDSVFAESILSKAVIVKASQVVSAPNISASDRMTVGGKNVATMEWVNTKIENLVTQSWVEEQGFITSITNSNLPTYLKVPTLSATDNMWFGGYKVATQQWVKNYLADFTLSWDSITGKPSYFPVKSHRHYFSGSDSVNNGHTHKVTVNGTTYTSQGVSTNVNHSIDISGYTNYTGG